ncbi:uncharacterized protein LOC62_05G006784 [Vanrija pseudolonga]|uniref:Uncharacterized protein n=1 Tax=Vanrija pseudolonga TaxID=143232 RepID=A0AAF0YB67_9TREE|nr:hypothetical protein LOC62_05G006784 [Vanrija pseudolonga]
MPSPDPKRQLRATASVESTAETYGRRHGIPDDVQAALQNVGWRSRQAVAMGAPGAGRSLQPTQSLPALPGSFMTAHQTYAHAQSIIDKEASRQHELQPMAFGSPAQSAAVNNLGLSPRRERSLSFTPDGEAQVRGLKRRDDDEEGSGTDVDDDVVLPAPSTPITAATAGADDFPAVFTSPVISQPELFRPPPGTMAPPPLPGRATRSLPRRGFSKTVSAPVGRLGTFSGMDVDMPFVVGAPAGFAPAGFAPAGFAPEGAAAQEEQEEDGFDVAEWASSENF